MFSLFSRLHFHILPNHHICVTDVFLDLQLVIFWCAWFVALCMWDCMCLVNGRRGNEQMAEHTSELKGYNHAGGSVCVTE